MLCVKNLSKKYGSLEVLKQLNFTVGDEEIVAVIGPSGCGKSTLLKMIVGLQEIEHGQIIGADKQISFIFQEDRLLPWRTVWENISLVRQEEDKEKIQSLIDQVGLNGFENYYPAQLSGGMKKRCGIARAFYYKSNLLLMDEPFSGLDYALRQEMLSMLRKIWELNKQSILFITHEIDEALLVADRILILSKRPGKIKKEVHLSSNKIKRNLKELEKIRMEIIESIMEESKNDYATKLTS